MSSSPGPASDPSPSERSAARRSKIPVDVWGVSFTSLFSDWGYEMVLPVLPFFLTYTLLVSPFLVGAIDGLAQFGQSVTSEISGLRWAHDPNRRRLAGLGYAATTVGHALIAITTVWPQVLVLRVGAWLGRGERQPIKRAILANASTHERQGRTFGVEQTLDSVGAVLGTAVAIGVMLWSGLDYGTAFRTIFALSVIPSVVAIMVLLLFVKDRAGRKAAESGAPATQPPRGPLPRQVRWFLAAELVFGLGYFSILLALLRVGETLLPAAGGSIVAIVATSLVIYLLYNLVFTGIAYPAGHWADRAPGVGLIALSFGLFIAVDVLLILGGSASEGTLALLIAVGAFVIAGIQVGLQGVAESAWLARQVPPGLAGRVFGRLGLIQGLAILAGSLLVGALWTYINAPFAFATSAVLCLGGIALLYFAAHGTEPVRVGPLPSA